MGGHDFVAENWYPDPEVAGQLGWWNAVEWTEHTRPVDPVRSGPTGLPPADPPLGYAALTASPRSNPVSSRTLNRLGHGGRKNATGSPRQSSAGCSCWERCYRHQRTTRLTPWLS